MFSFVYDKYDFWPIYDTIKRYYPLGIKRDESILYDECPGTKELEALLVDNIHSKGGYKRWEDFCDELELKIQHKIIGTTFGQAPCFSSSIEIERIVHENFARLKEIHFFVSILGPYYTIIGIDRNELQLEGRRYDSTNYIVPCPKKEYATPFTTIAKTIEEKFGGYRFVPYHICTQEIDGLQVRYTDDENANTVFNAIFNDYSTINLKAQVLATPGAEIYGGEQWIKEGYEGNGGWTSYPPIDS